MSKIEEIIVNDAKPDIAFLGMGTMGAPMAAALAVAGFPVTVWNRSATSPRIAIAESAGCRFHELLSDAVRGASMVFTCVPDEKDVEHLLFDVDGVVNNAALGTLIIDMSTISPSAAIAVHDRLKQRGLRFLDAPVSGGDSGAQNRTLTIMVGGGECDFARARPAFCAMGKSVYHCGPTGSGQAVKLVNQVLCAVNTLAVAEALALSRQFGLDTGRWLDLWGSGAGGSWALTHLAPRALSGDLSEGFALSLMRKDLRLIRSNGGDTPAAHLADQVLALAERHFSPESVATQATIALYQEASPLFDAMTVYSPVKPPYRG